MFGRSKAALFLETDKSKDRSQFLPAGCCLSVVFLRLMNSTAVALYCPLEICIAAFASTVPTVHNLQTVKLYITIAFFQTLQLKMSAETLANT